MTSITASTTHSMKKRTVAPTKKGKGVAGKGASSKGSAGPRGSAPKLQPKTFSSETSPAWTAFLTQEPAQQKDVVLDLFSQVLGETTAGAAGGAVAKIAQPRAASTTRDRGQAAADLATVAKIKGVPFALLSTGVYAELQKQLFPNGIEAVVPEWSAATKNSSNDAPAATLKASPSAVSLTSLDDATTVTTNSGGAGTDSKRGKTTAPNAREGCLLLLRALCEIVGRAAEPFIVGAFLAAALDECASSSGAIREAADDTAKSLVRLASPWAFPTIVRPLLLASLETSSEWRIKSLALECLELVAKTPTSAPVVQKFIPSLIPAITNQVWDTKAQVSKAAKSALLAICQTNTNPDIKKAIPAVVNAVCKPAEANKAVGELMATTFVVPVDASTLAILCPVLARALKEKLAIHKRAACLVVANMSKLVESPQAVAPFGNLLVPELQKVSQNVQFEEIRDEALKALANLTKALGDSYKLEASEGAGDNGQNSAAAEAAAMEAEQERVEAEQKRLQEEKEEQARKEAELARKEEEERKKFKEAMDAQRELDKIAANEAAEKKKAEELQREKAKLSTKGATGKCQACGLKKCKKSCMFYSK